MAYLQITGKLEDYSESSYTIQATGEQRTRIQLTLSVPSMRDRVLCEFNVDQAPATALLDRWESDESWVIVLATSYRALGFNRKNPRAGEKAVGALVVFQATDAHEATPEERAQLQEAKKAARIAARQRRNVQREAVRQSA